MGLRQLHRLFTEQSVSRSALLSNSLRINADVCLHRKSQLHLGSTACSLAHLGPLSHASSFASIGTGPPIRTFGRETEIRRWGWNVAGAEQVEGVAQIQGHLSFAQREAADCLLEEPYSTNVSSTLEGTSHQGAARS